MGLVAAGKLHIVQLTFMILILHCWTRFRPLEYQTTCFHHVLAVTL